MTEKKLTRKQKAFCIEYVKDFNGQKAAERAGYSQRTARNTASRLLKIDTIANKIDKHLESLKMDADEALRLLAEKARNADSESVQVRALETIVKVHGLADKAQVGDYTIRVIREDVKPSHYTQAEDTNTEAADNKVKHSQEEGNLHGEEIRENDS